MNWNIVTAVAGVFAAFAAVVGACAIVWQTRLTARLQLFNQLLSRWESADMQQTRSYAAGTLLNNQPLSPYADDVLDFFETVAMFSRKNLLDEELIWHTFFWPMACYWRRLESYIQDAQREEGSETWKDYSDLIVALARREGELPSEESVTAFLNDETKRFKAS